MIRKLAMAMVVSGALGSSYANALGLGEIKMNSALNQPLDAEVRLLNVGDLSKNEILPNLGSHDDFSRAGVERVFFLTGIKFDVELDGKGGAVLHLTTDRIVREPFLNFLIELHWPSGRLLREYTALLDPPLFSEAAPAPVQQAATAAPVKKTQSAPQPKTYTTPSVSSSNSSTATSSDTSRNERDGTVRVKKNDTLWGIAKKNRPDSSVTVRQTMVAIQQHNPQAFINNNINLLKTGQVLRIPEAEEIRRVSSQDARAETLRQTEEWEGKKTIDATQKYSSTSNSDVATADKTGLLKLVATEPDTETDDSAKNTSSGSAAEGGTGTTASADEEETGSGTSSINDVGALQKQLDDLQRLMTLKQEQLALLQATQVEGEARVQAETELAAAAEDVAAAESSLAAEAGSVIDDTIDKAIDGAVDKVIDGEAGESGAELATSDSVESLNDSNSLVDGDSGQLSDPVSDVTDGVMAIGDTEEVPAAAPAVADESRPQQGIMDILLNNPLYIGVLLVVILGGLILLGAISRRRKEEKEYPQDLQEAIDGTDSDIEIPDELDDDLIDVDVNVNDVGDLANAQSLLNETESIVSESDETRKLLDESDIFIAYGRYERAIKILQPAVNNEPENTALHLKLAEAYLLNKDETRFSQHETDLQAIGNADALASLDALKVKYADVIVNKPQLSTEVEELDFDLNEHTNIGEEVADELASFDSEESSLETTPDLESGLTEAQESVEFGDLEFELPEEESNDNLVDFETSHDDDDFLDIDEPEQTGASSADDMDFLVDTDESATKLELAKAYIDMADTEAAQEILNEVVSEGSKAQQQEASKLLENLE